MHGVRRSTRPTGQAAEEETRIARERAALARKALALRGRSEFAKDGLSLIARALLDNPDEYSLWSYRREALLAVLPGAGKSKCGERLSEQHSALTDASISETADTNKPACIVGDEEGTHIRKIVELWREELELSLAALKVHPKSYPAYLHRLWLLSDDRITSSLPKETLRKAIRKEFSMSGILLQQDGRNFHGWAHRMRVRAIPHAVDMPSPEDELAFVGDKINRDFANYSAWHHRSTLLPLVHEQRSSFLSDELEYVRQAFYTEPDVQSTWFYHRWLLAGAPARGVKATVDNSVLKEELMQCQELLDLEPDARWVLHAKADLLVRLGRLREAIPVYERLETLDPMRRGFYRDKISTIDAKAAQT